MAALAFTKTARIPLGNKWLVLGRTAATGVASAVQWVAAADLGLSQIDAAGIVAHGTAGSVTNVVYNAQGTGVAEGTNPGDLGVESSAASALEVWAIGR